MNRAASRGRRRIAWGATLMLAAACTATIPTEAVSLAAAESTWNLPRTPETVRDAIRRYEQVISASPFDVEVLWLTARACCWLAQYGDDAVQRRGYADKAVRYAEAAVKRSEADRQGAPPRFWLAVALGLQARETGITEPQTPSRMRNLVEDVRLTDPGYEHAGAERFLGVLYSRVPEGLSFGDVERARDYLQRAVTRAPDYPENRLELGKVLLMLADDERDEAACAALRAEARAQLRAVLAPAAVDPVMAFEYRRWQDETRLLLAELE